MPAILTNPWFISLAMGLVSTIIGGVVLRMLDMKKPQLHRPRSFRARFGVMFRMLLFGMLCGAFTWAFWIAGSRVDASSFFNYADPTATELWLVLRLIVYVLLLCSTFFVLLILMESKGEARCPEHGVVSRQGSRHCPECGEKLLIRTINTGLLTRIPNPEVLMVITAVLVILAGSFFAMRSQHRIEAREEAKKAAVIESMPSFWKDVHRGLLLHRFELRCYKSFEEQMLGVSGKHPRMNEEQIDEFLKCFGLYKERAYPILMRVMQERSDDHSD